MKFLLAMGLGLCLFGSAAAAQTSDAELEGSPTWALLAPEQKTIRERYEVEKPRYHLMSHADGSSTVLVYQRYGPAHAALFGISPQGKLAWRNYEPISETDGQLLSAAGDGVGNVLVAYQEGRPRAINVRLFDGQGKALWTTPVVALQGHDAVGREYPTRTSILFWPGRGWVVSFSSSQRISLQLLNEQGQTQWGEGIPLVEKPLGKTPVSLIQDTPDTLFVLWYEHGYMKKPEGKSLFLAQRLDAGGKPLWATPVEVGEGPDFGWGFPRDIQLTMTADHKVRAPLYKGVINDVQHQSSEYTALVDSQGKVETKDGPPNER